MRCDIEICGGCPYYYDEGDICMEGEEDVPDDLEKKCQREIKGSADDDINDALSDLNDTLREQIDKLEAYDKLMKKIYIIGSLSQANQIKKIADNIKDANVRYVQSEHTKTFSECVSACFDNIEWANSIYVILKPNGTIGQGVTYELEYAKRLNKEIKYIEGGTK